MTKQLMKARSTVLRISYIIHFEVQSLSLKIKRTLLHCCSNCNVLELFWVHAGTQIISWIRGTTGANILLYQVWVGVQVVPQDGGTHKERPTANLPVVTTVLLLWLLPNTSQDPDMNWLIPNTTIPNTSPDPDMNCSGIPGGNQLLVRNALSHNIVCAAGKLIWKSKIFWNR